MFNRPKWDNTFMDICEVMSKRSTCLRIQTASIIVKNNVIISVGYNGVAPGQEHCQDYWFEKFIDIKMNSFEEFIKSDYFYNEHHKWSNNNELHGEMNAILFAGKNGISLDGGELYTIYSPCINCAKAILTSGIKKVVYKKLYKRSDEGIIFLRDRGVEIYKF
jgi:dCMP deaminase